MATDVVPGPQASAGQLSRRAALAAGLFWALIYLWLAVPRLTAQGLYYDELHQATGSFAWTGAPDGGGAYSIRGIPVLNMPYSGAIKTGIYGLWLRASGHPFSVLSWRLLGCLMAAAGIFIVCSTIARRLGGAAVLLAGFLICTDMTMVLATRHDWGPVALAYLLRLLLIAVWLREWNLDRPGTRGALAIGALLGLAVFEKLSSIVLVLPVGAAFLLDARRRTPRQIGGLIAGGLLGGLPLLLVNVHSWLAGLGLISLRSEVIREKARSALWPFLERYAGLGNGAVLSKWILGQALPDQMPRIEGRVVLFLCAAMAVAALAAPSTARRLRAAGIFALLYVLLAFAIEALPAPTWTHHWVIGTPFQYLALALALSGLLGGEGRGRVAGRVLRWGFMPALVLLLAVRLPPVVAIEGSLSAGLSSEAFDVETTKLGEFVGRQSSDAVFIATGWGVANQVLCLSNARVSIREAFWNYRGPDDLRQLAAGRPSFFLVEWKFRVAHPEETRRMVTDALALPEFREVPVPEASGWHRVHVRRFDRVR